MEMLPMSRYVEQFLTAIQHSCHTPQSATAWHQHIAAWLPYYRTLQIVLGGDLWCAPADRAALFYLFARATLDGIAETVRAMFALPWTRAEFSHRRFTREFSRLCAEYRFTGDTQEVYDRLCELQARVVEPPSTPEAAYGETGAVAQETLHELMSCIEHYIRVLLHFLERNVTHSVLSRNTCPAQPHSTSHHTSLPAMKPIALPPSVP